MKWTVSVLVLAGLLVGLGYFGVSVANVSYQYSVMVNDAQVMKRERDQINAEWTRLLLEQKMLADDAVIDRVVSQGLDMHLPQAEQVVYLD